MATPPYIIATTVPAAADIIATYPPIEQAYRDTVLSWLTQLSDPTTGIIKQTALPAGAVAQGGYLFGLRTSPNGGAPTTTIDIQPGVAATANLATPLNMTLGSTLSKSVASAWVLGNGGGLDTGAVADATYHIYEIQRSDTGVTDICFSLSPSAPTIGVNIPAAYDRWRRIWSILRQGGAIRAYTQFGDDCIWQAVASADVNITNPGTGGTSSPMTVPTGLNVKAKMRWSLGNGGVGATNLNVFSSFGGGASITVLINNIQSGVAGAIATGVAEVETWTNTSGGVSWQISFSNAAISVVAVTLGYMDQRGRV